MKKLTLMIVLTLSLAQSMNAQIADQQTFCHTVAAQDYSQSGNMDQQVDYALLAANIINKGNIQMARSVGCSSSCSSGCSTQCSMTCSMRCGR